jgi:hypothetical protein
VSWTSASLTRAAYTRPGGNSHQALTDTAAIARRGCGGLEAAAKEKEQQKQEQDQEEELADEDAATEREHQDDDEKYEKH